MKVSNMPSRRRSRASSRGFTLVELMVTVAIISILAAIAIPSYKDYVLRARMTAMLAELSGAKAGVETLMMEGTIGPKVTAAEVGLHTPTELCPQLALTPYIRPGERRLVIECSRPRAESVQLWYSSTNGWSCNAVGGPPIGGSGWGWAPAPCKPYFEVLP